MLTYQDLESVGTDENAKMEFSLKCITEFCSSKDYNFGVDAKTYYEGENPFLRKYEHIIYDMQGIAHVDEITPNHKIYSRYVFSAITEGTQYLLANGVSFDNPEVKEKLGGDSFDVVLQKLLDDAQVYGVGWAFWNGDEITVLPYLQFYPLKDENTSAVKAGVRFWQIDKDKPLRFVLYELDGYTEYIQYPGKEPEVMHEKQGYREVAAEYSDGTPDAIIDSENFPDFPVIPLYYINQKSILSGNTAAVNAYDLLNSKMINNIDEGTLVYWVLHNCNAMDDIDDARFIEQLRRSHVTHADGDEGAGVSPHTVEAPVAPTEAGIARIKRLLDDNFMTCDTESLRAGNVTATQIKAAYQKLDSKTAKTEYCVIEFIHRLFVVAGINKDEKFTFKWDKTINKQEEIQSILQAAQFLDEETVTRMLLEALGKIDIFNDVMKRKEEMALQRYNLMMAQQEGAGNAENAVSAP